jgi:hypothetical protein
MCRVTAFAARAGLRALDRAGWTTANSFVSRSASIGILRRAWLRVVWTFQFKPGFTPCGGMKTQRRLCLATTRVSPPWPRHDMPVEDLNIRPSSRRREEERTSSTSVRSDQPARALCRRSTRRIRKRWLINAVVSGGAASCLPHASDNPNRNGRKLRLHRPRLRTTWFASCRPPAPPVGQTRV